MAVPVPLIRRNYIRNKLRKAGAVSPETAVTFREAGVFNPTWFPGVTRMMIKTGLLGQMGERYYLIK